MLLLISLPAFAAAENLSHLLVPKSGHLQMKAALRITIDNLDVKTFDQVVALRDKLNDGPLTEQKIISLEFLKRAGLKMVEPEPIPPSPNGVVVKYSPWSNWRDVLLDFDDQRTAFTIQESKRDDSLRYFVGPLSTIRVNKIDGQDNYFHNAAPPRMFAEAISDKGALSRDQALFRYSGVIEPFGDLELFRETFSSGGTHEQVLFDRERDAVLAFAEVFGDERRVVRFAVHLQMRSQTEPRPHQIPTVTMRFYSGRGVWLCDIFYIEKAELDVEIPPERFVVDVPAGAPYYPTGFNRSFPLPQAIHDATAQSPAVIVRERKWK